MKKGTSFERVLPKSIFVGAYFIGVALTIAFFIFAVFPMLWGLAHGSFDGAAILGTVYMFGVIPFLPWIFIRLLALRIHFLTRSNSFLHKIINSVLLGVGSFVLTGIVMVGLIFLVDILFG